MPSPQSLPPCCARVTKRSTSCTSLQSAQSLQAGKEFPASLPEVLQQHIISCSDRPCLLQGPAGSTSPTPEPGGTKEHRHWRLHTSATVRMKYMDGCCGSIPSSFIPTLKPFLCWEATWYWKQKLNYNVKPTQGVGSRAKQRNNYQAMGAAGIKRLWATGNVVIQILSFSHGKKPVLHLFTDLHLLMLAEQGVPGVKAAAREVGHRPDLFAAQSRENPPGFQEGLERLHHPARVTAVSQAKVGCSGWGPAPCWGVGLQANQNWRLPGHFRLTTGV